MFSHIKDKFDLIGGMLAGVMVRPSGEVAQELDGAVIPAFPAVNILLVGFAFDGSLSNSIFVNEN